MEGMRRKETEGALCVCVFVKERRTDRQTKTQTWKKTDTMGREKRGRQDQIEKSKTRGTCLSIIVYVCARR